MTKPVQKRKRRGVILSSWGWQRLKDAQEELAITKNGGYAYTLEQLSNLAGLSVRSITRLQSRKVAVDRQTLEEFFSAFGLVLTAQDYLQPSFFQPPPLQPDHSPSTPLQPHRSLKETETAPPLIHPIAQDCGEASDVSFFYGRTPELATMKQWTLQNKCCLVGIFGMDGIGKTTLSVKLAEQVQDQFTYVIGRSLIETYADKFTLQPVVMEDVTGNLIDRVCDEIANYLPPIPLPSTSLLQNHALIKAQNKDYVRDIQIRVILTPLITRLLSHYFAGTQ